MTTYKYQPLVVNPDNAAVLNVPAAFPVATVSSRKDTSKQWTVLSLYQTQGGGYVCVEEGHSVVHSQRLKTKATVARSESEVITFFRHGWLAKELYAKADIKASIDVA